MQELAKILKQMQADGSPNQTDMVYGEVVSVDPIEIRIDDRFTLGTDFLDMSNDVLDLTVDPPKPLMKDGDTVRLIKYSMGQRYYVVEVVGSDKAVEVITDYNDLENIPVLATANTSAQVPKEEEIKGKILLHKIAKTGNYHDLLNKPTIPNGNDYVKKSGDTMTGPLSVPSVAMSGQGTQNGGKAIMDDYSVRQWEQIPMGSDFNNYVNNGKFGISANASASTMKNIPTNTAGWLDVHSLKNYDIVAGSSSTTWANILQTYTTFGGQRFERTISSDGNGNWTYGQWNASRIALDIYPVGSVYIAVNNTNPATLFGGTWALFGQGQTLVGQDTSDADFNALLKTGGHKSLQAHTHSASTSIVANGAHTHSVSGTAASAGSHYHNEQGYYTLPDNNIGGGARQARSRFHQNSEPVDTDVPMKYGGAHTHSVSGTAASAGSHTHTASTSIGSSGGGNSQNLQPYIVVNFWRRTA